MSLRIRATHLALLLLPVVPAALAAQHDDSDWVSDCGRSFGWRHREPYCEVRVSGYRPAKGVITISPDVNGGVEVLGWDKDSVEIHARIQVQEYSDSDAKALAGRVRITTHGNDTQADGPASHRGSSWSVSFVVLVPRQSDLTLEAENGPIAVHDVNGTLRLDTENGPLTLTGVAGDVHARSQNGPVEVVLDGVRWSGTGLDAASENGPVSLGVPTGYNANLQFGTVNGPMSIGFPVSVTLDGRLSKRITTTLGAGGPTIRVMSTNGPFTLERAGHARER